jgi:hypothetical protein
MSKSAQARELPTSGPEYLGWRAELLAELALSRLAKAPGLQILKLVQDDGYDFVVAMPKGHCVFIEAKAFSSYEAHLDNPAEVPSLQWRLPTALINKARQSVSPVLLFLFDADTGHGRYIRLDTLRSARPKGEYMVVSFPRTNEINEENLRKFVNEMMVANPA